MLHPSIDMIPRLGAQSWLPNPVNNPYGTTLDIFDHFEEVAGNPNLTRFRQISPVLVKALAGRNGGYPSHLQVDCDLGAYHAGIRVSSVSKWI